MRPDTLESLTPKDRKALLEADLAVDEAKLEALDCGDFEEYLCPHGSHERLYAFVEYLGNGATDGFPTPITGGCSPSHGRCTTSCTTASRHGGRCLASFCSAREHLMNDSERERLAALPDRVTAHRGFSHPRGRAGIAWTLDRERAEWFARRFEPLHGGAYVATVTVARERVIAYFEHRNESEVLLPNLRGYRPCIEQLVDNPLTDKAGSRVVEANLAP